MLCVGLCDFLVVSGSFLIFRKNYIVNGRVNRMGSMLCGRNFV